MKKWLRTLSNKTKTAVMVLSLLTAQVVGAAAPFMPSNKVFAANNGTLKVHEIGTPSGTESNDPKVCAFNFEGFGFDPAQDGRLQIDVQGNDAPHGVAAGPFVFGPADGSGYAISQNFNTPGGTPIQNGHYKVTLYGKDANGQYNVDLKAKSKVFKVNCGVTDVTPVLNTQVSNSSLNLGASVMDTATFTPTQANGDVTGTVDFFVCGPAQANPNCTNGGTQVGSPVAVTNNQAVSAAFTPTQDGNYCFRANFTPDGLASYLATSHTNQTTECFVVSHIPQGTVTVVKNVDLNADGDTADQGESNVSTWNWNLDGQGNFATGSTNTQIVSAGNHAISEVQQSGFHVTASSCTGENVPRVPTTNLTANVADGENVICTFTNTRDTGRVVVTKQLVPSLDSGRFDLSVDGGVKKTNAGDNGTTGNVTVLTGAHNASEAAANQTTDITDYDSSYVCLDGNNIVAVGNGTQTGNFNVAANHTVNCVFTNVRHAHVTVVKDAQPNSPQAFDFALSDLFNNNLKNFQLVDDGIANQNSNSNTSSLSGGVYTVKESAVAGWDLSNISCNSLVLKNVVNGTVTFLVLPGQNLSCTFTNVRQTGHVSVTKVLSPSNDPGKFNLQIDGTTNAANVGDGGTTGSVQVFTGMHTVSETAGTGTNLNDYTSTYSCTNGLHGNGTTVPSFNVIKGANVSCTFTNTRNTGIVEVTKQLVPSNDNGRFDLLIDGTAKATNVGDNGTTHDVKVNTGTHYVSEVAAANSPTTLQDYDSSYVCRDGFFIVAIGIGTTTTNFNVAKGHEVECVFTNIRHATITVIKDAQPNSPQSFDFKLSRITFFPALQFSKNFSLVDNGGNTNSENTSVSTGTYLIDEVTTADWDLSGISCNAPVLKNLVQGTALVTVLPGQHLTCTYTNIRQTGHVSVTKVLFPNNDQGKFNLQIDGTTVAANVGNGGTTGSVQVFTGMHTVSETAGTGTNLNDYDSTYSCTNGLKGSGITTGMFMVAKGDNVSCTFTNQHKVVPQVLGDSTTATPKVLGAQLTNTGLPIVAFTLAALTLLGTALFVGTTRRQS